MESLDRHPHQPHVVAIGRGDGSICFMDLRYPKNMVKLIQAHSAHGEVKVYEVRVAVAIYLCFILRSKVKVRADVSAWLSQVGNPSVYVYMPQGL